MKLRRPKLLELLLVFLPAAVLLRLAAPEQHVLIFGAAALAVIPLAGFMGHATEALAARVGPGLGGFLSAALGNAAELILGLAALRAGEVQVVKASITGSIIGNLLLVFGAAAFAGGWSRTKQVFNRTAAAAGNATLYLAAVALLLPALQHHGADPHPETRLPTSIAIAAILLVLYGLSLLFSLKTHAHLYAPEGAEERGAAPVRPALIALALSTLGVVVASELLVESIEGAAHALGLSRLFVGVVVIAVVGNAAEHSSAVMMALRDKMDVALNIAAESSKQVALFVAPVLVFAGLAFGQPMDLVFSELEVVAVIAATGAVTLVAIDGESNWLEGAMLIAVYGVLAVAFFFA
jgi:Ca2+:H+ antiporter